MILNFNYKMEISFSAPVTDNYFSLICLPHDTCRQTIDNLIFEIDPDTKCNSDVDHFGNRKLYGKIKDAHEKFSLHMSGRAKTGLAPNEDYDAPGSISLAMFTAQSPYTVAGPEIRSIHQQLEAAAPDFAYDKALYYMNKVHELFSYAPGTTDVRTTAENAATLRTGVCQDYSHVLISLLRLSGIPARYVVGMMCGEGASHAWVEACCNGYWYGLDPTNALIIDDSYIKISHGRDYGDCLISRGAFTNAAAVQTMSISVSVTANPTNP